MGSTFVQSLKEHRSSDIIGRMAGRNRRPGRPRKRETPLARWIDDANRDRDELAEVLALSRSHLDRLCNGTRKPSLAIVVKLHRLSKGAIPLEAWDEIPPHSRD